jgi:polyhydroxyalkanoate synthesis regulator phasin
MMASYDVQGAGHIDTLKLVCKTSLKCNQLIDIGDLDSYQKMSRVYDQLMKSGKFTAAQNKAEEGEFVDSIGELVAICEKEGFIPRYYTDGPQDKIDRVIQDLQGYTKDLVLNETDLGALLEYSIKDIENDRQREASVDVDDETEEDLLFSEDEEKELTIEDYEEWEDFEDSLD